MIKKIKPCLYKISGDHQVEREFSDVDAPWYLRMWVLFLFDWFGSTRWLNQLSKKQAIDHCVKLSLLHIESIEQNQQLKTIYDLLISFEDHFSEHPFLKSFCAAFLMSECVTSACYESYLILTNHVDQITQSTFHQKNPHFCDIKANRANFPLVAHLINQGHIPQNFKSSSLLPGYDIDRELIRFNFIWSIEVFSSNIPYHFGRELILLFLKTNEDDLLHQLFKIYPMSYAALNHTFDCNINGEMQKHNILSLCIIFGKWDLVGQIISHCDQSTMIEFPRIKIPVFLLYAGRFESSRFDQTTQSKIKTYISENKYKFYDPPNQGDTYVIQVNKHGNDIKIVKMPKLFALCYDGLYDIAFQHLKLNSSILFEQGYDLYRGILQRTTDQSTYTLYRFNYRPSNWLTSALKILLDSLLQFTSPNLEPRINSAEQLAIEIIKNNTKLNIYNLNWLLSQYEIEYSFKNAAESRIYKTIFMFIADQLDTIIFGNDSSTDPIDSQAALVEIHNFLNKVRQSPKAQQMLAHCAPIFAAFYDLNPYLDLPFCDITEYEKLCRHWTAETKIEDVHTFPQLFARMMSSELNDDTHSQCVSKTQLNNQYNLVLYQVLRHHKWQIHSSINQIILSSNHGLSQTIITHLLRLPKEIDLTGLYVHYYHNLSLYCQNEQIGRHIHGFLFSEDALDHKIMSLFNYAKIRSHSKKLIRDTANNEQKELGCRCF
ncbi:MAG: hypothetical protein CMF42_05500 [Legionellales bacterium]|nr:hypothetical protein [Legionellales bacterium]OUX66867.1 MAG: hypothetical protein CBD38_03845 [bacterium TMED178]